MSANVLDKIFGRFGNRLFQSAYIYAQFRDGVIPDLYLQDPKYFEKYALEIKTLFGQDIGETMDMVSIHVRRAANPSNLSEPEYSENPFYVNLMETDYYQKAMSMFSGEDFLIFSDDIEWCKKQDIFKDCEFSEGNTEDDFNFMASCKDNIIANSSFSYWAAYLNKNLNKKVIAPKAWYTDGGERTKCPPDWIRI